MEKLVENPLVSVRVLTYNQENYIAQCLDGILSQKTDFPFEVIIGEDCSTDNTRAICRSFKEKFPHIINLIENDTNLGPVGNGERTIAAYRGKYVAWCDGDDAWSDPHKLQKQVDILERHSNIAICFHPVKIIYEGSDKPPYISNPSQKQISTIYDLALNNFIHSPSVLFRRGLYDVNLELLKTDIARDYAVHLLNASKGDIYFINEVMAIYREHPKSAWTSKSLLQRQLAHIKTLDMLTGLFNKQIDDIFTYVKSIYYLDIFNLNKKLYPVSELKQYIIKALENSLIIPDFPNIDALNNKILEILLKIIDRNTDHYALLLLSKLALKKHLYDDSIVFLDDVLKINPNDQEALLLQAKAYFKSKKFDKTALLCQNLIEQNENPEAKLLLANAYYQNNQFEQALDIAEKLYHTEKDNFTLNKLLALLYFKVQNYSQSKIFIEKALNLFNYDIELLNISTKLKLQPTIFEETPTKHTPTPLLKTEKKSNIDEPSLISIIIHTQNNAYALQKLINSIYYYKSEYDFEIIVVDNASQDETLQVLKKIASTRINFRFIRNYNKVPLPRALNNGIKNAYGNYFVVLNNISDVTSGWLDALCKSMESMNCLASLPKINSNTQLIFSTGIKIQSQGNKIDFLHLNQNEDFDEFSKDESYIIPDAISFDCLAFPKKLIDEIDIFDEQFHSFLCEIDFSLRAKEKGYSTICLRKPYVARMPNVEIPMPDDHEISIFSAKYASFFKKDRDERQTENTGTDETNQHLIELVRSLQEQGELDKLQRLGNVLLVPNLSRLSDEEIRQLEIDEEMLSLAVELFNEDHRLELSDLLELTKEEQLGESPKPLVQSSITPERPRILLTMYGWNESGGGTTFPKSVALAFARRDYDVAVFYATAQHPATDEPYYLEHKVENGVHLYGVYNRPTVFLDALNPEREIKDEQIIKHFERVLDEFKPDIIHYNNFLGLSFAIADLPFERNIPSVFTTHNYHLIDPMLYLYRTDLSLWDGVDFFANSELAKNYPQLRPHYERRIFAARKLLNERISYTLAVSRRVRELLVQFGANPDKIAVVHQVPEQAQNLASLNITHKNATLPLKFGFIGGVMPHKGAHLMVQAAQSIPEDKAQFYVYGFVAPDYLKILKLLDINKKIHFEGEYKIEELPKIAENLDAVILPSIWEDCAPLVIAEALAMRLPVIAARIGGFPDFIDDGINGKLYSHNSPSELAKIIWEITQNPSVIDNWRANCKLSHNFDDYLDHLISIYKKLIAKEQFDVQEIELIF